VRGESLLLWLLSANALAGYFLLERVGVEHTLSLNSAPVRFRA
jgi:hypothetical protein